MTSPHTIEDIAFKNALRDWLSGKITGHLGSYMYTDDEDDHRWKDGHSAAQYYLGRDDKASFSLAVKDLNLNVRNFLDLGPGGKTAVEDKSIPMLRALDAQSYFPVDLSAALANEALITAQNALGVDGHVLIADFFKSIPGIHSDALLAIMGGTIANFETHLALHSLQSRLTQIFSIYRQALGENGYFLLSFDANDNGDEIINCYDNPEFGFLVKSCVSRAIDVSGFSYYVAWTPDNFQLATGLRALRDQTFVIDDQTIHVPKNAELPVLNSYRFPVSFVKAAATDAGWTPQQSWSATGRVHYILFKKSDPVTSHSL